MTLSTPRMLAWLAMAAAALLAGCGSTKGSGQGNAQYDFGPAAISAPGPAISMKAIVITDVTGSPALDNERMFYRLNYADPLQARSYANSRWSSTPLQLVTQRMKSRVVQSGVKVLSVTDAAAGIPILRMEIDDFSQNFDSPAQSHGQLVLRVSLFQAHVLVDQRSFNRKVTAASADAGGGARALADATDATATDVIAWLATLKLPKE
jgi:cholesterol transport system auxiliary component